MQEKIENLCGLSFQEFSQVVFAKWARAAHAQKTTINYTFDINSIPSEMKQNLLKEYSKSNLSSLSEAVREEVRKILNLWQPACGNHIEFSYQSKLEPSQMGITIIGCDNLGNARGLTDYNQLDISQNNELIFNKVLICIPSTLETAYDQKTISHELGHALGLDHIHDVETIKKRLLNTEQGQGCSVMGYNSELQSPVNKCNITKYCADQPYATLPGPMDSKVCTTLYGFPQFSQEKYFNAMLLGFLNGTMETSITNLLKNLNFINISHQNAANVSMAATTILRNCISQTSNLENFFLVSELAAQLQAPNAVELIKIMRTLAGTTTLFMQLYQMYANEEAYLSAIYLAAFLGSNLAGLSFGEPIGQVGAMAVNKVADNMNTLFRWGADSLTKSANSLLLIKNHFFSRNQVEIQPVPDEYYDLENKINN